MFHVKHLDRTWNVCSHTVSVPFELAPTVPPGSQQGEGPAWPTILPAQSSRRAQFQGWLDKLVARRGTMGALPWPAISRAEGAALIATAMRVVDREAPSSSSRGALDEAMRAQLGWSGNVASPWRLRDAGRNYCAAPAFMWGAVASAIGDVPVRAAAALPVENPNLQNLRRWASVQLAKMRREIGDKLPRPPLPILPNPFAGWGALAAIALVVLLARK